MSEITRKEIIDIMPMAISECALYLGAKSGDVCMSDEAIYSIAEIIGLPASINVRGADDISIASNHNAGARRTILDAAKIKTKCTTERCVIEKLLPANSFREISLNLKITGPTSSNLLTNVNIDSTLQQWATMWNFFPYNFNMLNYAQYSYSRGYVLSQPDTLATINYADLYAGAVTAINPSGKKYPCAACVINTDRYQGNGKHWMALFVDARTIPASIEFFNSSGRAPAPEFINWMEKTKNQLLAINVDAVIIKATSIQQQKSGTECGLYSLFYIWARLHNVPAIFFNDRRIPDEFMFEFRHHLFHDPTRPEIKKFVWSDYQKKTKIEWV